MAGRTQRYARLVSLGKRTREDYHQSKSAYERAVKMDDDAEASLQEDFVKEHGYHLQFLGEVAKEVFDVEYDAYMKDVRGGAKAQQRPTCEV